MRTTLTLDDDVAAAVEHRRRERQHSLKQEVNELLRIGLLNVENDHPAGPGLRVEPWNAGECLLPNLDNIAEVISLVEGEDHR